MTENALDSQNHISPFAQILKDIGSWLKHVFDVDTPSFYKEPENDAERQKIIKIRKINLIEFFLTLSLVVFAMWVPWWQGILQDNSTLQLSGYILIGLVGIWGLILSPFYHFYLEKGFTYRKGYLGLDYEQNMWTAVFEERGLGSIKKHWDVNLKDAKMRKIVTFVSLYVTFTIIVMAFGEMGQIRDIAVMVGIPKDINAQYAAQGVLIGAYQGLATLLLIYGTYQAGQWKNTGDKDGLKKFLLIGPQAIINFVGIWLYWGFGINFNKEGKWSAIWDNAVVANQTIVDNFWNAENPMGVFVFLFAVLVAGIYLFMKYIGVGILIRFDNLRTSMFQFIFVSTVALIVIILLREIMAIPSVNEYILANQTSLMGEPSVDNLPFIFDETAEEALNKFNLAGFFSNFAYYIYWGALQEFLFLGYWCTILTKVFKNKHLVALFSSACFGFIHFPSWPLMILTMVGGYFWAIAWQRNDSRNLFVMGAIHGFAGTLVAKFIPITMSVGPSNMA
jgi:hypothetical protein